MRYLILGCGWVGEFVANLWLKEGHEVWASTTTAEKYHRLKMKMAEVMSRIVKEIKKMRM